MKNFFASCAGTVVGLLVIFFVFIIYIVSIARMEKPVIVEDGSVLHLKLDKQISELEVEEPLANILPGAGSESIGLMELRNTIKRAKEDSKIQGIYLNAPAVGAGFSTLDEIRTSLQDFRSSGKWVIAYSDYYSEGGYYLSSAADKVYMNPTGQVELNGLAIEVSFYKKLFDKLEIKPEVFRVGDFKSAVEPFMRENMSDENRLQLNEMINSIYAHMLDELSKSRNVSVDRLKEISSKMLVRNAKQAVDFGLIDTLYYDDEVKSVLRERLSLGTDKSIPFIKYSDYKKSLEGNQPKSDNEIAVIVADGDILPGKADQGVVGSTTIRDQIRKARTSDRVKAIVIRVNSPGGAFTAADEMWREVYLAAQEKPVIGSMGDYAASGGYYLAMACDTIVAQPNTITGSIGVFSVLFDLSDFLGNKIGVTSEQVKTGEIGNLVTVTRPLTPQEKGIWQTQTNEIYEIFTNKAAKGRNMSQDDIKKVASGRVWTGSQALERGLVDKLGSFEDAVNIAAELANVGDDYKLRYYPEQKSFIEKWLADYEEESRVEMIKQETGEYYRWYQQWEKIKTMQGTQARMPFEFIIQ